MNKLNIYGIPEAQMREMREAADLSWRGIAWPKCGQVQRHEAIPREIALREWAVPRSPETELEASLHN